MATGYEHLTDEQFWAEVDSILELVVRTNGGTRANATASLADYVHAEAQHRDPELAAIARRRKELAKTVASRQGPLSFEAWDTPPPYTEDEQAERQQLFTSYSERLAALAAGSGR